MNHNVILPWVFLFIFHWTEHPGIWYHDLWSTTVRIRVTVRLRISTSPLFTLFTCCWMSLEAVLGNTEFELVVFGVTLAVVIFKRYFTIYVILDFTPYEKSVSFQFLIFINNTYFTQIIFPLFCNIWHISQVNIN